MRALILFRRTWRGPGCVAMKLMTLRQILQRFLLIDGFAGKLMKIWVAIRKIFGQCDVRIDVWPVDKSKC